MLSAVRRGGNQSEALPNDRSSVPRVRSVKDSIGGSPISAVSCHACTRNYCSPGLPTMKQCNRLKWVVHLPQNGTIGFDPQPN